MRGRFFVFEGIDGCGKSTQAELLAAALRKRGLKTAHLREPGGTPVGEAVRKLLLDHGKLDLAPMTEVFLFMASRTQLVCDLLRPALDNGDIVVLDRYYYSTAAYQGAAGKVGIPFVLNLADIAGFPQPDRVFLLDLDPTAALARTGAARDRIEQKGLEYQRHVRAGFLEMAKSDPERFRIVNAAQPANAVAQEILREVERVL
ncbi:MAG: dTMP kinase [Planctomycetes bacterium]|nr:dTMP kinase [Planctomycetota bacterium]